MPVKEEIFTDQEQIDTYYQMLYDYTTSLCNIYDLMANIVKIISINFMNIWKRSSIYI